MSETQKFAEIEKTLEGLRGLSDLPEEERKKMREDADNRRESL